MTLQEAIRQVADNYLAAKAQTFGDTAMQAVVTHNLPDSIRAALGGHSRDILVEGSAGRGRWADIPWAAVFLRSITESATTGYYVVYLFDPVRRTIHLSLNQGTTKILEEHGQLSGYDLLRARADLIRRRLASVADRFPVTAIELSSTRPLPRGYVAGHALGYTYASDALPNDSVLSEHLREVVSAYRLLFHLGGVGEPLDEQAAQETKDERPQATTVTEIRRYRTHRVIERQSGNARKVKNRRGYTCEACGFNFFDRYGPVGENFIEAHHLTPLASLDHGQEIQLDPDSDFCVLCSNCHRMIHKLSDPSDLVLLKSLLDAAAKGSG